MRTVLNAIIFTAAAAAAVPVPAGAADAHQHGDAPAKAPRPAAPAAPRADDRQAAHVHDHMKKMEDLMARMQKAADPEERRRLMEEHMKSMHEGMAMMKGMGGGGMSGGGMAGMPRGGNAEQRMQAMERRLDMLQSMMEQMMAREKAGAGAPR